MPIEEVTMMLRALGAMYGLGEQLLQTARQSHPELRTEDPGPLDAAERARADALKRTGG